MIEPTFSTDPAELKINFVFLNIIPTDLVEDTDRGPSEVVSEVWEAAGPVWAVEDTGGGVEGSPGPSPRLVADLSAVRGWTWRTSRPT